MINVRAFGALGDGSTDDTVAIQNAINSLYGTGGVVFFPSGDYVISGDGGTPGLTIAISGISLVGEQLGSGESGRHYAPRPVQQQIEAVDAPAGIAGRLTIHDERAARVGRHESLSPASDEADYAAKPARGTAAARPLRLCALRMPAPAAASACEPEPLRLVSAALERRP